MLLFASAQAAPLVVSVSEEIATGLGGGWGRAAPAESGWHFFWSAGGDYVRLPMTDDLTVTDRGRTPLTGHTDLIDHALTACPDGSWLHAASANVSAANDTAYVFRYDADFGLVGDALVDQDGSTAHNDLAVVCSGVVDGVAWGGQDPHFARIAADGSVEEIVALEGAPSLMGASLAWRADTLWAVNFGMDGTLQVSSYDADLQLLDQVEVAPDDGPRAYWGQGLLRVGQTWVLAHMARDDSEGWPLDLGDVYLSFYDDDWTLLERDQLSENPTSDGGMRPGLALDGDELLVLYDKDVQPRIYDVRLDLDALGPPDPDAEDDTGGGDATPGCGCTTPGAPPGISVIGLALLAHSRRRCVIQPPENRARTR